MLLTVREYARAAGLSEQTVRKKLRNGRLKAARRDDGVTLVDDGRGEAGVAEPAQVAQDAAQAQDARHDYGKTALESRWDVENELKRKKIENIRADIVLKRQKAVAYRERLRVEFAQGVLEAYTDAFADLKGVVVDLKMRKEQTRRFRDTYAKCLRRFEALLVEYLKTKDLEEEKEDDGDDIRRGD